jgi:hypothetical protein
MTRIHTLFMRCNSNSFINRLGSFVNSLKIPHQVPK